MNTALQIKPELQAKLEILAHTTHRDSEELVNEALELYLQTDRHYCKIINERIEQAKRGEFATDEEVEAFFTLHAAPE
jgi:predicted transcriptional regulator